MTLKFEVLAYPVYNPDLSLYDYEIYDSLKKFLEGKHFYFDKEVKKVVKKWMLQVRKEFWRGVIYKLPKHWQKHTDRRSDYIEN